MTPYRCAERGCELSESDLDKETCPTCGNPMNVLPHEPGPDDTVGDNDPDDDPEGDGEGVDQTPAASGDTPPAASVRKTAARRNRRV